MNNFYFDVLHRKATIQLFRFGLVGIVSNLVGFIIYLLMNHWGSTPKITLSILYGIAAAIGFFGNKSTFTSTGYSRAVVIRYMVAHCLGYFINFSILVVMVDKLELPHQYVQAFAILIVAAFLFFAFKFFVFRNTNEPPDIK